MRKRSFKALSLALLSACMLAGASITAGAVPENLFSCSTSRDAENDILVDFKEVQITLPSSWAGKCQVSTAADSASFFHIQSRKLWTASLGYENGGFLFSINFSENMDFTDLPSYQLIGETAPYAQSLQCSSSSSHRLQRKSSQHSAFRELPAAK